MDHFYKLPGPLKQALQLDCWTSGAYLGEKRHQHKYLYVNLPFPFYYHFYFLDFLTADLPLVVMANIFLHQFYELIGRQNMYEAF